MSKVIEDNHTTIGVLYQNDDIGIAFTNAAKEMTTGNTFIAEPVDAKSADFRTNIAKLLEKRPSAVVIYILGQGAGITINQLRESGYTGQIYSSQGLTLTPGAIDIARANLAGTYYLTYEQNPQFSKAYQEKFGKNPPILGVIGYTDIELLTYAIDRTKSQDPKTLVDFIKGLKTFKGTYEIVDITPQGDILIQTVIKKWE